MIDTMETAPPETLAKTFLGRLDRTQQEHLLGLGRVRRYPAQSILFFEGDDAYDVVVVRSGELKVAVTVEEREVLLDVLGEGEPIGSAVVINGPLTQGDIAAWAGLSREAVVKALHGLRTLGWVTTTPRSITVVNVDAVTSRAALT